MFAKYTDWTQYPCYYVIAFKGNRRAYLAGPYRTAADADRAFHHVTAWALTRSGDKEAKSYHYRVSQEYTGETRGILGEWGQ
jgi:hypothetical protein